MLYTDGGEKMVRAEILCSHAAEPQRGIGQGAVQPGEDVVDDETGRIDDHLAGIEQGLQEIGKDFARGKVRLVGGAHVQAQRARQNAVEIEPEQIDVAPFIVGVGKHPAGVGRNRSVAHVRLVAEAKYGLALRC